MPKLKTKSSLKKGRFKIKKSVSCKSAKIVMRSQAGKRHGMTKRKNRTRLAKKGMLAMFQPDARRILRNAPYGI